MNAGKFYKVDNLIPNEMLEFYRWNFKYIFMEENVDVLIKYSFGIYINGGINNMPLLVYLAARSAITDHMLT